VRRVEDGEHLPVARIVTAQLLGFRPHKVGDLLFGRLRLRFANLDVFVQIRLAKVVVAA
jgi:hypothetical protein